MDDKILRLQRYSSPAGEMILGERAGILRLADWECNPRLGRNIREAAGTSGCDDIREEISPVIEAAVGQLDSYFAGEIMDFDLRVEPGGSEFRRRVLEVLRASVPYGFTESYSGLARLSGNPGGARSVALALASNPLSVIFPCHRILGADGSLRGYAGGIPAKRYLLALEGNFRNRSRE